MERQNIQVLGVIDEPLALELLERVRQDGPLDLHEVVQEFAVVRAVRAVDRQTPLDAPDIEPAVLFDQRINVDFPLFVRQSQHAEHEDQLERECQRVLVYECFEVLQDRRIVVVPKVMGSPDRLDIGRREIRHHS